MYRRALASFALVGVALVLTGCPSGTVTPSATPGTKASVAAGSNVAVNLAGDAATGTKAITVNFGTVSAPGDLTVATTTTAPALPAGVVLATSGMYFDFSSSAKFDKATVCLENDNVTAQSKLLHYSGSSWDDVTTTVAAPKICGDFTSFSPVAIVQSSATATPTATATAAASATASASASASASATAAPTETPVATTAAPGTTAPVATTAPPSTTAPATTAPPTTAPPTPTPVPTQANPWPGYIFAPNASGSVPAGFTRYGATITDASTGAPVVNACVYTGPPSGCPLKGVYHTDANGFFAEDLPSGSQFAFNIQSDPNNAIYGAIIQRTLAAGTSNSLTMTHK